MTNKHIERASYEENVEGFALVDLKTAFAITFVGLVVGYFIIELIFGADDFIYWVANLIA